MLLPSKDNVTPLHYFNGLITILWYHLLENKSLGEIPYI